MPIVFTTKDEKITACDGRFTVEPERTPSGYIRGWYATDSKDKDVLFGKNRASLKDQIENKLSTELPEDKRKELGEEIKLMLRANREMLVRRGDATKYRFDARDGYYGEAFGILRALKILGFGKFGAVNVEGTLQYWFAQLEDEVIQEEKAKHASV